MTDVTHGVRRWLNRYTSEPCAYLTTTGRRTGRAHRIEIWFAEEHGRMYLLSGGRDRADWVRNIRANPQVTVELGDEANTGIVRILQEDTAEDRRARDLLVAKYATTSDNLDEWKRRSLPLAVEFPPDGE